MSLPKKQIELLLKVGPQAAHDFISKERDRMDKDRTKELMRVKTAVLLKRLKNEWKKTHEGTSYSPDSNSRKKTTLTKEEQEAVVKAAEAELRDWVERRLSKGEKKT